MGDSLQDQLRALGLAANRGSKRQQGRKRAGKAKKEGSAETARQGGGEMSLDQAYALRQRQEQREASIARERKLAEQRRRRELNNAIRQIVSAQRQNREDADLVRNFLFNGRIRKIYVTSEQQMALNAEELGIVYLSGSYHLLQPEALEAVRCISAEHVIDLGLAAHDDDPDHPVPDDLIW
jgi:uncharacterized protein YaiL (DUF2058 family)